MVKATSLDMSLSDIIKTKKTAKKGIRKVGAAKKGPKGAKPGPSGNTPRRQSGGIRKKVVHRPSPAVNASLEKNRTVRINVSNLAHTVVSNDLRELFGEFRLRSAAVNFNEHGEHLGTGDLTLSKINADHLIRKYAGVAVDGKVMQFAVIESPSFVNRTATPKRRSDAGKPPARKAVGNKKGANKPVAAAAKKTKKPKREPKVQKTAEELDAELDAYMSRSG